MALLWGPVAIVNSWMRSPGRLRCDGREDAKDGRGISGSCSSSEENSPATWNRHPYVRLALRAPHEPLEPSGQRPEPARVELVPDPSLLRVQMRT